MIEGAKTHSSLHDGWSSVPRKTSGLANPNALLANAAFDAVMKIGWPEGRIPPTEARRTLAYVTKSTLPPWNQRALAEVQKSGNHQPLHLRKAPTKLMQDLGYGKEYKYPPGIRGTYVKNNNTCQTDSQMSASGERQENDKGENRNNNK